MTSRKGEMCR